MTRFKLIIQTSFIGRNLLYIFGTIPGQFENDGVNLKKSPWSCVFLFLELVYLF